MNLQHQLEEQLKVLHLGGFLQTLTSVSNKPKVLPSDMSNSFNFWSRMKSNEEKPKNLTSGSHEPLSKKKRPWRV